MYIEEINGKFNVLAEDDEIDSLENNFQTQPFIVVKSCSSEKEAQSLLDAIEEQSDQYNQLDDFIENEDDQDAFWPVDKMMEEW